MKSLRQALLHLLFTTALSKSLLSHFALLPPSDPLLRLGDYVMGLRKLIYCPAPPPFPNRAFPTALAPLLLPAPAFLLQVGGLRDELEAMQVAWEERDTRQRLQDADLKDLMQRMQQGQMFTTLATSRIQVRCFGATSRIQVRCFGATSRIWLRCFGATSRIWVRCFGATSRIRVRCFGATSRIRVRCLGATSRIQVRAP